MKRQLTGLLQAGLLPSVAPRLAGSAPYYVFTQRLGLPMVAAGLATIDKLYLDLLYALADAK